MKPENVGGGGGVCVCVCDSIKYMDSIFCFCFSTKIFLWKIFTIPVGKGQTYTCVIILLLPLAQNSKHPLNKFTRTVLKKYA